MASGRNARIIPQEAPVPEPTPAPQVQAEPCSTPTVKKERPGFEMISRQRQALGKGRGDFASAMQWTTTQIKKLERGEYIPLREELADILTFLAIDPEDDVFIKAMKVRPDSEGGITKLPPKVAPAPPSVPEVTAVISKVPLLAVAEDTLPAEAADMSAWLHKHPFPNPATAEHRKALGKLLDDTRLQVGDTVEAFCKKLGITSGIFYSLKAGRTVSWEQCNAAITALDKILLAVAGDKAHSPEPPPIATPAPEPTVPDATSPRAETLAKAEKILKNPRLTDQEVQQLVALMQTEAVKLLLGDME